VGSFLSFFFLFRFLLLFFFPFFPFFFSGVLARAAEGQSIGINFPGPSPLPPALEAGAQQQARGNEINTPATRNRLRACEIVLF
jgi:hypothetical protein